jgi:uncharacterized phage-associated protein
MTPPYSPLLIANYFIVKATKDGEILTPMKLIKLVYIAHGWHLALLNMPLISEDVQAWTYGPVVPTLYHTFKRFGSGPVALATPGNTNFDMIDERTKAILNRVWESYKKYSGTQLSNITHLPNTPWDGTHNAGLNIIPNALIKRHYKELSEQRAIKH